MSLSKIWWEEASLFWIYNGETATPARVLAYLYFSTQSIVFELYVYLFKMYLMSFSIDEEPIF